MKVSRSTILSTHLFFTFLSSIALTQIFYAILNPSNKSSLEGNQAGFIEAGAGVFFIFILTLSSLTVFFTLKKTVRENMALSLSSFFLFPLLVTLLLWFTGDKEADWQSFIIAASCFLVVQFTSYLIFLKKSKRIPGNQIS